jgi:energy-coupling factor transport system ATP-binding protein
VSVLELREVSYTYPDSSRPALDRVSLEIDPGELVVLAGASGSGKSTLLRAANGLVPHFHGGTFAGRVVLAGLDTREHRPGELAGAVGTLFQDPETQVVMGTVRAELGFGLENRGWSAPQVARGVEEAALALGIAHLLDRPTAELSGGELQRVALGAALSGRPRLILLDEPTSQLDPVAGDELIASLRRLNEDADVAIILCEHRLERCLGFADRVVAMDAGRVVRDAPPAEFLEWSLHHAPALATPGARLLDGLGLSPAPGVRGARNALRDAGIEPNDRVAHTPWFEAAPTTHAALQFDRVWHELRAGPAILRSVSVTVAAGEKVALMGRNGAGKSTLLRHAAALLKPTRGKIRASGRVALLLQNPNDYLVHDTVAEEAKPAALEVVGLTVDATRHPRDLSGGERQRLALAVVLGDPSHGPPAVICLDEPTRGMDRGAKDELARLLRGLDSAVMVATHDAEFAASFADRVILLADGTPIADAGVREVLSGGTYFATETARILSGAGRALKPEEGVALLRPEVQQEVLA